MAAVVDDNIAVCYVRQLCWRHPAIWRRIKNPAKIQFAAFNFNVNMILFTF